MPTIDHNQDSDCTLNEQNQCVFCHVSHNGGCLECNGRGYHEEDCPTELETYNVVIPAETSLYAQIPAFPAIMLIVAFALFGVMVIMDGFTYFGK